jgi:hypothetical protein
LGRGKEEINVEETLRSVGYDIPTNQYNSDGKYKWPFGLPIISALRFPDKPRLLDVLGSNLSGSQWAAFALDVREKLGDEAQAKLEALPTEIAQVVEARAIIRQREKQRVLALSGRFTGPPPSMTRSASETTDVGGCVYWLRLQGAREVFKIGKSKDAEVRLAEHNKPLLTCVTGFEWTLKLQPLRFPTERQAWDFEQAVHRRLRQYLPPGETEIYRVAEKEIDRIWWDEFSRADWAISHSDTASSDQVTVATHL